LRLKRADLTLMWQQNPFKPRYHLGRRAFSRIGFWHLHDGTPALFLCYSCAQGMFKPADIEAALNIHKEACFARQENEA
jgi:hypothetical protein